MKKKIIMLLLGVIVLIASGGMYWLGNESSNLSELKDFWYMPLPLGVFLIIIGMNKGDCADGGG